MGVAGPGPTTGGDMRMNTLRPAGSAGRYADRRHRDESVELARCRYRAWRRAPAVEEARCRRGRIAKATASVARGSRESRTQDRTHCSRLRGWPGWFLAGALVEDMQH